MAEDPTKYGTPHPVRSASCFCGRVQLREGNTSGILRVYCECDRPTRGPE